MMSLFGELAMGQSMGASQSAPHARTLLPKIAKDSQICVLEEKDLSEIVDLTVASFVGNATTLGEQTFRWGFGPENRGDPPDSCEHFNKGIRWYMYWCARACLWYGSCVGARDRWRDEESGKLLACALCFHPGSIHQRGKPIGMWRFINMVLHVRSAPPDRNDEKTYGPWAKKRFEQINDVMHELHAHVPGRHWSVWVLAGHPEHKGKGCGSKVLRAVMDMATLDADPLTAVYLECADDKKGYYEKQRMTCFKTKELVDPNPEGEGSFAMHGMVCVPSLLK